MSYCINLALDAQEPHPSLHPVAYHQQNRDLVHVIDQRLYCGAAAAQMVLDSIGSGLLDQDDLYTSNNTNSHVESGWHSGPDGVAYTLETLKPHGFPETFQYTPNYSEEAISRKICWSIHHYGVDPIALVFGNEHWVVVTGFCASKAPLSSTDTSYTIFSFWIHNPSPLTPYMTPPPPHHTGTDGCGIGLDRGTPHELVAYSPSSPVSTSKYWQVDYMTPIQGGTWHNKYIVVGDSDPAANLPPSLAAIEAGLVTNHNTIIGRAMRGLDEYGLTGRDPWRTALATASPGEPILVEREDVNPRRHYYIVPFVSDNQQIPFLVHVGGEPSGAFAGSIAAPSGASTHLAQAFPRNRVIDDFADREVQVGERRVSPRADQLLGHLVWRPCAESLSPYWPFYRFDADAAGRRVPVYVRIDGERYPELHIGKGM
jgi:hypothetical protein